MQHNGCFHTNACLTELLTDMITDIIIEQAVSIYNNTIRQINNYTRHITNHVQIKTYV